MSRFILLLIALVLGLSTTAQREQFAVYAVDLPYHTHITSTLTEQAVAMLNNCSEPLTWSVARGWDLPAGYSRFRMLIAIPDLSIYAVIQEHYWATGGSTARRPYAMRLNGTGWYGASYNAAPTPHGAAGSCWIDGGALNAFEAELRRDANWPG